MCCLVLKDDATAYLWLFACKKADAATTVQALMQWFADFGVALV
jgi:hypothetical protein